MFVDFCHPDKYNETLQSKLTMNVFKDKPIFFYLKTTKRGNYDKG